MRQKNTLLLFSLCLAFLCTACFGGSSFEETKKQALTIWREHPQTFYCGCAFDKYGQINFKTCDYEPQDYRKDKWISWEHVVPVSWYGKKLTCWKKPSCVSKRGKQYRGRKCCAAISESFRKMENDLHNLVPVIRQVNTKRENYRFAELDIERNREKFYVNHCPIVIDARYRLVEPPEASKGMVARITLYIAQKYDIDLGDRQYRLLTDWNSRYPVTPWEIKWNRQVAAIQGDSNPFIEQPAKH